MACSHIVSLYLVSYLKIHYLTRQIPSISASTSDSVQNYGCRRESFQKHWYMQALAVYNKNWHRQGTVTLVRNMVCQKMTVTSPANGWPLSIISENCIAFGLHHGKNGTIENLKTLLQKVFANVVRTRCYGSLNIQPFQHPMFGVRNICELLCNKISEFATLSPSLLDMSLRFFGLV